MGQIIHVKYVFDDILHMIYLLNIFELNFGNIWHFFMGILKFQVLNLNCIHSVLTL